MTFVRTHSERKKCHGQLAMQLTWREKNHNKRYNKWLHVTCNYYTCGKQMKKCLCTVLKQEM